MQTLTDAIAGHGAELVESAAWRWLDELGVERTAILSEALAVNGVDGLADLVLVGPALGGLDDEELKALIARIDAASAPRLVA